MSILESDLAKYLVFATMLLAILVGSRKGRDVASASDGSASGRSRSWTYVPLIALAIASLGPSVFAILIYFGYKFGLLQPPASGYRFSSFIQDLPLDYAVINWPFAVLFLICRLWPNVGPARSAMWCSVVAMALPNIVLLSTAWEMVSNARDAGQGIGIIEAVLSLPITAMIWSNPLPGISGAVFSVLAVLTAPIPVLGLVGWMVGRLIGGAASDRKAPVRS
jgi:hypothetical protein